MYIWSNSEGAISLLYSRPVFIFFIVVLSALLITILMQNKKQLVTGLHVITIAIISLLFIHFELNPFLRRDNCR
ncbi:hypothetical protein CN451_15825 [Priestia megaterium]|nr:hypothetical protein CN451_15825 [Priestia megaterium]